MKKLSKIKKDLIDLALPIGMVIAETSPRLPILWVNDMFVEMLGFSDSDELIKAFDASSWNFVSPLDRERLKLYAETRIGTADPYEITYRVLRKDGSCIWVSQNSLHTFDENGREVIFAYYSDITVQKQMEEAIRAGVKQYETLVNSVPGGVSMYHLDERLSPIFLSERVYELCGMTREEYNDATQASTLDILHPDDRQGFLDAIRIARIKGETFNNLHRALQKNGGYRWMRISGQVMADQDDVPILYAVITDVNEQIQSEHALLESESRFEAAVRAS
ncbi:MAG: PAS domain-containing protein, partial [Evtepia sp.]